MRKRKFSEDQIIGILRDKTFNETFNDFFNNRVGEVCVAG
jgi:hypothetical protein